MVTDELTLNDEPTVNDEPTLNDELMVNAKLTEKTDERWILNVELIWTIN